MKKPKNMQSYVPRDQAAIFLLAQAYFLLRHQPDDQVKISIQVSYWNDSWADGKDKPAVTVDRIDAQTGEGQVEVERVPVKPPVKSATKRRKS